MDNFLTVPSKVENLIIFGFFICLDAFLNVITFLPMRVMYALFLLLCEGIICGFKLGSTYFITFFRVFPRDLAGNPHQTGARKRFFHRSHLYDIMKGSFMILACYVLLKLNMSRVYHFVRGQNLIKLYVLTAMLEIFDKLLCSFGQDAFDSLHYVTCKKEYKTMPLAFIIAGTYTVLHSSLYFMLLATLTVAINSSDHALVTVLVLNNFGEIRSFVFKKFDKSNLFHLSCSDITERFQLVREICTVHINIIIIINIMIVIIIAIDIAFVINIIIIIIIVIIHYQYYYDYHICLFIFEYLFMYVYIYVYCSQFSMYMLFIHIIDIFYQIRSSL
jgi:hypothetical protein